MRKICVVTGYRSDYTKLKSAMEAIRAHPALDLQIVVFGAHLLGDYGNSINDIESDGYNISYKCSTNIEGDNPLTMSKSIGLAIIELAAAFEQLTPDIVLMVGDRYEILAAATTASIGNIPVAHIQGGEVSGTIDETIRHTVTKLSHVHFPSTELSRKRILLMGENPDHVFNVGCPAIDYIKKLQYFSRPELKKLKGLSRLRIDLKKPYFILIQHPVTTEFDQASEQMETTLNALQETGIQTLLIYPNPDAGSASILREIRKHKRKYGKQTVIRNSYKNLPFESYLNLLRSSSCLIGNSSSGIREAHQFGVPAINIGTRQLNRERTSNIIDVGCDKSLIKDAINRALKLERNFNKNSIYGDGTAGKRIAEILSQINLDLIIQKVLKSREC
tara:strand:+ start:9699 stop:10868 length:1170 start_codon:yes stop_codon:yes gene_type:complete